MVLDFANEGDEIVDSFAPYFEATLLSEETDPHLLYDLQQALSGAGVFTRADIDEFAKRYFGNQSQDLLYAVLKPLVRALRNLITANRRIFALS